MVKPIHLLTQSAKAEHLQQRVAIYRDTREMVVDNIESYVFFIPGATNRECPRRLLCLGQWAKRGLEFVSEINFCDRSQKECIRVQILCPVTFLL